MAKSAKAEVSLSPVDKIKWQEDLFRKGIQKSIIAHGVLFAAIIFGNLVAPKKINLLQSSVRVDLIGLPDVAKKDLAQSIADQLQELSEKPAMPEKSSPKNEASKAKNNKKDDAVSLNKKEKKDNLKSAIDRIKSLQAIEESMGKDKTKPNKVVAKGNQLNKGNSLTGTMGDNFNEYADLMRTKLSSNWDLPVWLSKGNYSAQIMVYLDRFGNVSHTVFVKPSGNKQFDEYVLRTIKVSQPFGPPPAEIVNAGVTLGFPL